MRRLALAISLAALALGGCKQSAEPAGKAAQKDVAVPDAKPGLILSDGRLILNAVKGNPAAAYFTLANGSDKPVTLAAVYIDGAGRTELHQTSGGSMGTMQMSVLAPGSSLTLSPGGGHVMVFDPDPAIAPGGAVEMTLTFADGDKLSAPLSVESAGGMEHMH